MDEVYAETFFPLPMPPPIGLPRSRLCARSKVAEAFRPTSTAKPTSAVQRRRYVDALKRCAKSLVPPTAHESPSDLGVRHARRRESFHSSPHAFVEQSSRRNQRIAEHVRRLQLFNGFCVCRELWLEGALGQRDFETALRVAA